MRLTLFALFTILQYLGRADDTPTHGEGAEGTVMGPVAFLWPNDRSWNSTIDNTGPCGSLSSVTNRTSFPLSQGSVALTIADESYNVALRVAYSQNPISQDEFKQQVVTNVSEVEPGHQCYKIGQIPDSVTAGTNATIQLEYWGDYEGENNGKNESFFACADVTFVEAKDFKDQVPCFNVTSSDFNTPSSSSTLLSSSLPYTTSTSSPSSASDSSSSGGLSAGTKAGIAVGTILGSFTIVGVVAFALLKKRRSTVEEYEMSKGEH